MFTGREKVSRRFTRGPGFSPRCLGVFLVHLVSAGALCCGLAKIRAESLQLEFREPRRASYILELPESPQSARTGDSSADPIQWLPARRSPDSRQTFQSGSRLVIQTQEPPRWDKILTGRPLTVARRLADNLFILQAPDALTAARQAAQIAGLDEVVASVPVMRRPVRLHSRFAPEPNDPFFADQWNLENRESDGRSKGLSLNVREAWPDVQGDGVTIAVVDDGIDLNHPDLAAATVGAPHFNFDKGTRNGNHGATFQKHGTAVSGLAVARGFNQLGVIGVAPRARLASWVVFSQFDVLVSDEDMMDMFQYRLDDVEIQNHSWGNSGEEQLDLSLIEKIAIRNAVETGRDGLGVVMVRAGGNGRGIGGNVNDDGYALDPQVITVGAVRRDGRASGYSNPGACLLVSAPSGDSENGFVNLPTTDRQSSLGYNTVGQPDDPSTADYGFGATGFSGTSASAPQISGLVALLLETNPTLHYRDVQQILIHSAIQSDLTDPDLAANAAGFVFSHNTGFGVPDAGFAVDLARNWVRRPPLKTVTKTVRQTRAISDDGMRVLLSASTRIPSELRAIHAFVSQGRVADQPTEALPLKYVGLADSDIEEDLSGFGALIKRGEVFFSEKIRHAAEAGAEFAIIFNNIDGDERVFMDETDYSAIPAVFIGQNDGEALLNLLIETPDLRAQLRLLTTGYFFEIDESMLCEHVGVRVDTDHTERADVRLTLTSPNGTRSVLQRRNFDSSAGPRDWTYYSVKHFYEQAAGTWTLSVSDTVPTDIGSLLEASLVIRGVALVDSDRDGLEDSWEIAHFDGLSAKAIDDPDRDGFVNAREQILHSDPLAPNRPFSVDLSFWKPDRVRLSWPGQEGRVYEVLSSGKPIDVMNVNSTVIGRFPVSEAFLPASAGSRFFKVRVGSNPE